MTCFWDGILKGLKQGTFFKKYNYTNANNNNQLIKFLKENSHKLTEDYEYIKWNNQVIIEQQVKEDLLAIKELNIKQISRGYLCSTCDCFLLLICALFQVNIFHKYMGHTISYINEKNNETEKNPSLFFESNKGHFWFVSYIP
jgi:hypothetical protein